MSSPYVHHLAVLRRWGPGWMDRPAPGHAQQHAAAEQLSGCWSWLLRQGPARCTSQHCPASLNHVGNLQTICGLDGPQLLHARPMSRLKRINSRLTLCLHALPGLQRKPTCLGEQYLLMASATPDPYSANPEFALGEWLRQLEQSLPCQGM